MSNKKSSATSGLLDFETNQINQVEEDILAQYFWNYDQQAALMENYLVESNTQIDKFSMLSSKGSTTLSSHSSDTDSEDDNDFQENKSGKLTEATKDTTTQIFNYDRELTNFPQVNIEREIFLISKLKKREPRRSFDLGELTRGQEIVFEKGNPVVFQSRSICVDKEKIGLIYNSMVDNGYSNQDVISNLTAEEKEILEILLKLRLSLTKSLKSDHNPPLLADQGFLNDILNKNTCMKKRSEELLKKNFKTVLKTMYDRERKLLPKGITAMESRKRFTEKFFGAKARDYDRIFKCIQMSQDYYSTIFEFTAFKDAFTEASQQFMSQFSIDRNCKTENLINQIKTDIMSAKVIKPNLRTPWSIKEAESSSKMMAQYL